MKERKCGYGMFQAKPRADGYYFQRKQVTPSGVTKRGGGNKADPQEIT